MASVSLHLRLAGMLSREAVGRTNAKLNAKLSRTNPRLSYSIQVELVRSLKWGS